MVGLAPNLPAVAATPAGAAPNLPATVSLRYAAVPVGDQGARNSGSTWAIDYGLLGWYSRAQNRPGQPFAPMYTYSQLAGGVDHGARNVDVLNIALKQGNDTRADYAAGDTDFHTQPTADERAAAAHFKIKAYHVLFAKAGGAGASNAIMTALASSHPVVVAVNVRPGFDHLAHNVSAVDNDITGTIRTHQSVLALGYDANGLLIENSWGTAWGAAGYGRLSWRVVQHDVAEAETIDGFANDTAAPTMALPTAAPVANATLGATTVAETVSFHATSSHGIAQYKAYETVNGGALQEVALATPTTTTFTLNATFGVTYRVGAKAIDPAGRASAVRLSPPLTLTRLEESAPNIAYSDGWSATDVAGASGGHVMTTSTDAATATVTATTSAFSWIATRAPDHGTACVVVDGSDVPVDVNTLSGVPHAASVVYTVSFPTTALHTLQIENCNGATIDLDAILVTTPSAPAAPAVPVITSATPRFDAADITFTIASNGGEPITGIEVVTDPATHTFAFPGSDRTAHLSGLDPAVAYNVQVRATNAIGTSAWSSTAAVTPNDHVSLIGTPTAVVSGGSYDSEGGPSGDAHYVFDDNIQGQLERRDLTTGATVVVSVLPDGTPSSESYFDTGSGSRARRHVSTDGRYAIFWATSDGTDYTLYRRDITNQTTVVIDDTVSIFNNPFAAEISGDGQSVALIRADESDQWFVWRWNAGELTQLPTPSGVHWRSCNPLDFSMSNDGTRVAFDMAYCADDGHNGLNAKDVYVYDVDGGEWQATAQYVPADENAPQTESFAGPRVSGDGSAMLAQVMDADQGYTTAPEHLELFSLTPGQGTTGTLVPGSGITPDDTDGFSIDARYWVSSDASVVAWGWMPCANGVVTVNIWDRKGAGSNLTVTEPCGAGATLVDVKTSDDGNTLFFSVLTQSPVMYEQQLG